MDFKKILFDETENNYIDYKAIEYTKEKCGAYLKDILSMVNSKYEGEKYVITGVKDKVNGDREILGIDENQIKDQAIFQQWIHEHIEPKIEMEYHVKKYNDSYIGLHIIKSSNKDKPYMISREYKKDKCILSKGDCYIRVNSINERATRRDFDYFYQNNGDIKIQIKANTILITEAKSKFINNVYAPIPINIINSTKSKVIIENIKLIVRDNLNNVLCENYAIGFNEYRSDYLNIEIAKRDQVFGKLLLSFTSNDCLNMKMDENGLSNQLFNIELEAVDTLGEKYISQQDNVFIRANGDILHKVKVYYKK